MRDILVMALFGALGSLSRYGLSGLAYKWWGGGFAYGTLLVNVLGCFVLALLMQTALTTDLIPPSLRLWMGVGFLGAFTTFSTFGYETMRYLTDGAYGLAAANAGANLVLGFGATLAGLGLGRLIAGGG